MAIFRSKQTRKTVNIYDYVTKKFAEDDTLRLYLAIDSKMRGRYTNDVICAVIYSPINRNGAEIWYNLVTERTPKDFFSRLWNEVEMAAKWCPEFYDNLRHIFPNKKDINIHLDLNEKPVHKSHSVYKAGMPYIGGLGFSVVGKPKSWAHKAADHIA